MKKEIQITICPKCKLRNYGVVDNLSGVTYSDCHFCETSYITGDDGNSEIVPISRRRKP